MTAARTFTLSMTEAERLTVLCALGHFTSSVLSGMYKLMPDREFFEFVSRVARDGEESKAPSGASGTEAAKAILAPAPPITPQLIDMRDRWAHNRQGQEVPNPEGCETQQVSLWKTEQKPGKAGKEPYLKVTWAMRDAQGYADANCFDKSLFPWLIARQGKLTTLYTVRNGKYLNVVGVRA